jgi:hypothetical protein
MGQHEDVLKLSFVEVCRQYGFGAEDGLKILETEFNRRVDNSYGNFIMAVCIEEAFEDQRRRKVKFNKNRALIPILPRLCHFSGVYPTKNQLRIPRLNLVTKKISKGYIPVGKVADRGKAAQEEWNRILKEKFEDNTFRTYDYQALIKNLLKRYDTVKKKEKIYNFWKRDFLKVVTTFDVGLTKAHTFEELENFAKKKRLKSLKLTSK